MVLADVILPLGPAKALSYEIPSGWVSRVRRGMCVKVPLRRHVHIGIVWRTAGVRYRGAVETIGALLSDKALFSAESLHFLEWLSSYYLVSLNEVLKHSLPAKLHKDQSFFAKTAPVLPLSSAPAKPLSPQAKALWTLLATKKPVLWPTLAPLVMPRTVAPLIAQVLSRKQAVLYLVPDAALVPLRTQELFMAAGLKGYAFHAQQSPSVHASAWRMVAEGHPLLLLGSKSAVLLPFHRLGLVIIEEEQHSAYKEDKRRFSYHVRDSALMLAQQHKAACLLLSPSPSLESLHNLQQKKYQAFEEVIHTPLSPLKLYSLQEETRKRRLTGTMSRRLHKAIGVCLDKRAPVLVFHPRKGMAPYLSCEGCAARWRCSNCGLTARYDPSKFRQCAHCGASTTPPPRCPVCDGDWVEHKLGTGRVEEVLKAHFPQARVASWLAKTKPPQRGLRSFFQDQGIDILVSTPRYLYGWEGVEEGMLVLWDAERWLQAPDFRSQERLFQWVLSLRQRFCGLAFWIQAQYALALPFFDLLADADYEGFVKQESKERKTFGYPPHTRLLRLCFQHTDPQVLDEAVHAYRSHMERDMPGGVMFELEEATKRYEKKTKRRAGKSKRKELGGNSPHAYSVQGLRCKLPKKGNTSTLEKERLLRIYQRLKRDARFQALGCTFDVDV